MRKSLHNSFDVLPSGRLLVVYDHASKLNAQGRRERLHDEVAVANDTRSNQKCVHGKEAIWGAPRARLCVAWSSDDDRSWQRRVLEDGDGYCMTNNSQQKLNRELSYPSVTVGADGWVHVAYIFWRQKIKYVCFRPDALEIP